MNNIDKKILNYAYSLWDKYSFDYFKRKTTCLELKINEKQFDISIKRLMFDGYCQATKDLNLFLITKAGREYIISDKSFIEELFKTQNKFVVIVLVVFSIFSWIINLFREEIKNFLINLFK